MNDKVKILINKAVKNILNKMNNENIIKKFDDNHNKKIHFIPKSYRIFGGILQSMNIQFGNFIEELMLLLIENEGNYEIITKYSGKKNNIFTLSKDNSTKIDAYIDECQLKQNYCYSEFTKLQQSILDDTDMRKNTFKHDVDLLFRDKKTDKYYYLEIKYNDDHDTGKFIDINRKFIKTYAYLTRELGIKSVNDLIPILFFFNNKQKKGNIYIPESTNIRRGEGFFNEFLTNINYKELNEYMTNLSESSDIKKMFDELHDTFIKH